MCTTRRRIPASAGTNQGPEKGDLMTCTRQMRLRIASAFFSLFCKRDALSKLITAVPVLAWGWHALALKILSNTPKSKYKINEVN